MKLIEAQIGQLLPEENSNEETEKITIEVVKKAAVKMEPQKMDIYQGFSSDCFLNAPNIFFSLISLACLRLAHPWYGDQSCAILCLHSTPEEQSQGPSKD